MSRARKREIKKIFKKDIVEFLKVQHHFLPDFIDKLGRIKDPRHQSYKEYDIEEMDLCQYLGHKKLKLFMPHL